MASLKSAHAGDSFTLTITPNPAGANQPITFSADESDTHLIIYMGSGCTGTQLYDITVGEFAFTYTLTSGLSAGSYSSTSNGLPYCENFTVLSATTTGIANSLLLIVSMNRGPNQ
jgi:hypothetical protein